MNYFCDTHIQSRQDQEAQFYIVLEDGNQLTKEVLSQNMQYREFCEKHRPKLVLADYIVYSTEAEVYAAMQDEDFDKLIAEGQAERIAQSELQMEPSKEKASGSRKRRKSSPITVAIAVGCILVVVVGAFGAGKKLGRLAGGNDVTETVKANEDGMIIPEQEPVIADAEQITVSIDRSYTAVPTEDLQLKAAVVDGKAQITLPVFDKEDFFTHVPGYTWGFSSSPEGEKIEYYGGQTYSFTQDTKLYRVLVKYGGGSGTKDDPYRIDYYDQLELMGEEKARGYFLQTADIVFPDWVTHKPIDTVNELKSDPDAEYFEYDGGGYSIRNLTDSLFGKISGAQIRNVNIRDSFIQTEEYRDCGFIACAVYNYRYDTADGKRYETGETVIKHCTVSHSAIYAEHPEAETQTEPIQYVTAPVVVPPDVVEYDEDGNIIEPTEPAAPPEPTKKGEYAIGAITGLGSQIEDCYVTDFGIFAYLDDYILYAGGISGKPANVVNSCVYYYSAQGNIFNAGGIVGSAGGARHYNALGRELPGSYGGSIQGCAARNIILQSEVSGGGIAGEAGTDAEGAMISNCYANELNFDVGVYEDAERQTLQKAGQVGGIIGTDGKESKGHTVTGCVSSVDFPVIGGKHVSAYDDTVRLAPAYAFYQENILSVINRNSVYPDDPKEIFTGCFRFGDASVFGDDTGALPYPETIEDLFEKTRTEENYG